MATKSNPIPSLPQSGMRARGAHKLPGGITALPNHRRDGLPPTSTSTYPCPVTPFRRAYPHENTGSPSRTLVPRPYSGEMNPWPHHNPSFPHPAGRLCRRAPANYQTNLIPKPDTALASFMSIRVHSRPNSGFRRLVILRIILPVIPIVIIPVAHILMHFIERYADHVCFQPFQAA